MTHLQTRPLCSPPSSHAPSPPPPDDDPYGGGSADMYYDHPSDEQEPLGKRALQTMVRVALNVRWLGRSVEVKLTIPRVDYENDYEQNCEQELARRERISRVAGRPWDEVREVCVLPWHWWDDLGRREKHEWPHEAHERLLQLQERQDPPPLRDDPKYGQRSANPQGDEQFRADRALWFESVTGESLEGLSLAEQWRRVDRVARAFRAHTRDGRPGRSCDA